MHIDKLTLKRFVKFSQFLYRQNLRSQMCGTFQGGEQNENSKELNSSDVSQPSHAFQRPALRATDLHTSLLTQDHFEDKFQRSSRVEAGFYIPCLFPQISHYLSIVQHHPSISIMNN